MLYRLNQPSQSSCLSRCFADLLGRRNHRCRYLFIHKGWWKPSEHLTVGSLYEEKNMSSSISSERSCKFTRGDLHAGQPEGTEECDVLLLSDHKNH